MGNWKLAICLAAVLALVAPAAAQTKDTLSVDLPGDAATLDPHVQWDTDSYTIYRNIFDNLLTRDAAGKIFPQIGARNQVMAELVSSIGGARSRLRTNASCRMSSASSRDPTLRSRNARKREWLSSRTRVRAGPVASPQSSVVSLTPVCCGFLATAV